ncbi:MAG: hypothetical protein ACRC8W_01175 [Plesiomonas shigelloides]
MSLWGLFGSPPENQCTKDMLSAQKQNDIDRDIMSANIVTSNVAAFAQQAGKPQGIAGIPAGSAVAIEGFGKFIAKTSDCGDGNVSMTRLEKVDEVQQGYFDQCNDIISDLEETLSALQLTVSDLHAWAFGSHKIEEDDQDAKDKTPVPSWKMQNRLIDALEHATAILSDANEVQIFMMGGEYEGAPDDWVDDLQQSAQESPVKQAKPETLEAVEAARKIVDAQEKARIAVSKGGL